MVPAHGCGNDQCSGEGGRRVLAKEKIERADQISACNRRNGVKLRRVRGRRRYDHAAAEFESASGQDCRGTIMPRFLHAVNQLMQRWRRRDGDREQNALIATNANTCHQRESCSCLPTNRIGRHSALHWKYAQARRNASNECLRCASQPELRT